MTTELTPTQQLHQLSQLRSPLTADQQLEVLSLLDAGAQCLNLLGKASNSVVHRILQRHQSLSEAFVLDLSRRVIAQHGASGVVQLWPRIPLSTMAQLIDEGAPLTPANAGAHFSLACRCVKDGRREGAELVWAALLRREGGHALTHQPTPEGGTLWHLLTLNNFGRLPDQALGQIWAERLLSVGLSVTQASPRGFTPLMGTAFPGLLLELGADPLIQTHEGWTALHYAARNWPLPQLQTIVAASHEVINTPNQAGDTALHLALRGHSVLKNRAGNHNEGTEGHYQRVKMLLDAGADETVPDASGMTPRELMRQREGLRPIAAQVDAVRLAQDMDGLMATPTPVVRRPRF